MDASALIQEVPIPATGALKKRLAALGVEHVFDLLLVLPLRYEDRTCLRPLKNLQQYVGQRVLIQGKIVHQYLQKHPPTRLQLILADDEARLSIRFLHVYPKQELVYSLGSHWRMFGEIRGSHHGLEMIHPQATRILPDAPPPLAEALSPVYPKVAGISSQKYSTLIHSLLSPNLVKECLPADLLAHFRVIPLWEAMNAIHRPQADEHVDRHHPAWRRLVFDELLAHQCMLHQQRKIWQKDPALPIGPSNLLGQALLGQLPFQLTVGQRQAWEEIRTDLQRPLPMQRLLQGDVGCGKTIVAAIASLAAIEHQQQVALMVPTEVLAIQHFHKFKEWFTPLGVTVHILLGSQKKSERQLVLQALQEGESALVIGTHALFQEQVHFARLNLVIIDEQHRFGVEQRSLLKQKARAPHMLMMSATPIPRTLAMSYFADLDVSTIDMLPSGRSPIRTRLIQRSRLQQLLGYVETFCVQGRQVYWVCPLIEDSETLGLQNLMDAHNLLKQHLPHRRLALLHGRMKTEEKQHIMKMFAQHEIDILLATTVIEVGVDVPNASLMVIEHPERMGLAQLHQLRGRVGRGKHAGECVLFYEAPLSELSRARLKILYEYTDGFEIARQDLLLRGPGEILGLRQSGIPQLRFAHLEEDQDLLREIQIYIQKTPHLLNEPYIHQHIQRWYRHHFNT
jgi:ATP-dependent DNA helicase RecG